MVTTIATGLGVYSILILPALIWNDSFIKFFGGSELTSEETKTAKLFLTFAAGKAILTTFSTSVEAGLFGLKDIRVPVSVDIGSALLALLSSGLAYTYIGNPTYVVAAGLVTGTLQSIIFPLRSFSILKRLENSMSTLLEFHAEEGSEGSWSWRSAWGCFGIIPLFKLIAQSLVVLKVI